MTMAVVSELACVGALLALGALAVALARFAAASRLIYGLSFLVTSVACVVAVLALAAPASEIVLPLGLPWMGAHFRVDALTAFFLAVVNFGGAAASFYAIGYGAHEEEPARVLPFYPAFIAGMNLVVLAGDAFAFLLSWEFMSLTSWALVMSHHKDAENRRAGYVYLLMASFGTLCLLLAFGLLAGADGGYVFAQMHAHQLSATLAALVLGLALLGAGSKAGLFPLHVWLPMAHPAAPSHVSALMSGVMTKVAVYAFIRIVFDLVGFPDWWWSVVVLVLGGVTAVMGVLYALMQCDLKRLLAYSTVENIGIIFIGLGLALAFRANHMDGAAALALTGALLHVLNHAVFKSLLFFGAGAVLNATGLKDIEKLGGLIHRMRITSTAFLVGAVAISALPPFNGFVSEWLTFQAVLLSPQIPQWGLKLMVPTAGTMLALAAALAGACFVRGFGVSFLGRARSAAAAEAQEVDRFSLAAMTGLALLCLLLGILPAFAIDGLAPVVQGLVHAQMPRQLGVAWWTVVPIASSRSSYNGLLVFLFIAFSASMAVVFIHQLASRIVRRGPAWDCGTPSASTATQYTAGSFAQPIRRVFGSVVFRAREAVTMPAPGDGRPAVLNVSMTDLPWDVIYDPIRDAVNAATGWLNRLQFMTIRRYLTLVFMTLILLLLVLAIW
ncbi:MAG: hydrogenase 4 subunit B [Alphaproteobacteria bacterium]|nr:hydrogenase 4 subunit B [Alphaproteobacteria bacterium]MDE2014722.1 hydrogenase 4 subunit B [Alphaproteobacteria bacterium]MDE2352770.1 hydrogenase 4 subunit B [Alphaproteobacteria bacterium]